MADSEISTSLSSVTRRMLLAGTALVTAAWTINTFARWPTLDGDEPDAALRLWKEWNEANLRTSELCRRQQGIEARLFETVGFPRAEVDLPEEGGPVLLHSQDQIEEFFGNDPSTAAIQARAEDNLAAHQARWDAADSELGYSAAKQEEETAALLEQELVDALMNTPATSLAGVASKLDAILREGESSEDCPDFPWPFIRSALADLVRIVQRIQPDRIVPGTDWFASSSGASDSSGSR
ncbi:hypothetical protein [Roseibium aggregatum]|uniref:Uncharacterized protein n=1 Tax=Roseibium aggregatum TaxID=187304 RepID=A0A926NWJ6_9HYPH|nr:hypothetical protein [Roseibium aggregatum]MBD1548682.1 hypothetical protein [Roseibium aggregatum]